MLPNVLGIGVQRAGTTWLHRVLSGHPQVYVPQYRKELHYFDRYYNLGVEWYRQYFAPAAANKQYRCIVEITPMYIYDPQVPERIHTVLGDVKFLVILRNPVARAFSQYKLFKRQYNLKCSFSEFLKTHDDAIKRGFYYDQLQRYFAIFPRSSFMIMRYEDVFAEPLKHLDALARFLDIDASKFDTSNISSLINEGFIPKYGALYATGKKVADIMRDLGLDRIVHLAKKTGLHRIAGRDQGALALDPLDKQSLINIFKHDIEKLQRLLSWDCSDWMR